MKGEEPAVKSGKHYIQDNDALLHRCLDLISELLFNHEADAVPLEEKQYKEAKIIHKKIKQALKIK